MMDEIGEEILKIIEDASIPLETKEIHLELNKKRGDISRSKLMYRLNNLLGEGKIEGKYVGSGKGVWIWWSKKFFKLSKEK